MPLLSFNEIFYRSIYLVVDLAIYWVPPALIAVLWVLWMHYVRTKFWSEKDWVLLEIRLPKIMSKTPQAMEVVLGSLNQGYDGTFYDKIRKGFQRSYFSLEIVSLEGKVHFFIRTDRFFKSLIETQIYAQFPDVEVFEVEDYMLQFSYYGDGEYKLWGSETELRKDDTYPIKTYVDYGLDKPGLEEEEKIDPLSLVIETLGSLGPGEFGFVQIFVQAAKKKIKYSGLFTKEEVDWNKEGVKLVEKLMKRDKAKEEGANFALTQTSPGEKAILEAVERSLAKAPYDCGIRLVYMAKEQYYNRANENGVRNILVSFNSSTLNAFKGSNATGFAYPWQDPFKTRTQEKKREMFDAYRKRSYYYPPYVRKPFVLSTEELATIFHFPGGVVTTPTLSRIESKKVEPPANLPL